MRFLMVLADGETYTILSGCQIVAVPDNFCPNMTEEAINEGTAEQVMLFGQHHNEVVIRKAPDTVVGIRPL